MSRSRAPEPGPRAGRPEPESARPGDRGAADGGSDGAVTRVGERRRTVVEGVLGLLEERHGIGVRGETCPAWMQERMDRALGVLSEKGRVSPEAIVDWLRQEPEALGEIADLLRVGETGFFRDGAQWQAIADAVMPGFVGRSRVRALSAGCATGEEAWTLAMLLDRVVRGAGDSYRVVGLDRSPLALETARQGVYPPEVARRLPPELSRRYLVRDPQAVRIAEKLRAQVSFVLRDVMLGPPPGEYEIIVCKNLLIYFGEEAGRKVVRLLFRALAEGGVLVVARSEVARIRALGHVAEEIGPEVTVFRT